MCSKQVVKRTVIYEGLFIFEIDEYEEYPEEVQRTAPLKDATLAVGISNPHVTIIYKPAIDHSEYYGRKVYVIVNGYANDGINEGYSVELIPQEWSWGGESKFNDFCSLFAAEEYHLTLSVSEDGRPVDTGKLKFSALPINRRKVYECRFGAFVENQFSDGSKDTEYVFNRS